MVARCWIHVGHMVKHVGCVLDRVGKSVGHVLHMYILNMLLMQCRWRFDNCWYCDSFIRN